MKKYKKCIIIVSCIIVFLLILVLFFYSNKDVKKLETTLIKDKDNILNIDNIKKQEEKQDMYKEIKVSMPIFMYHFILDDYGKNLDTENFVKPSTLEAQLKYISENGYQTVFLNEIEDLKKYDKPVALTFDDCFVYFYNNAYPLLKKYNQKATIYIIVDYINGENYLTDAQIKEMADSGLVSVQTHTLSHRELTRISLEEARKELVESKKILEERYNIKVDTVCYPIGKYNNEVINIVKENYKYGLAMTGGMYYSWQHDLYKIPRIYANRSMSLEAFVSYLKKSKVEIIY